MAVRFESGADPVHEQESAPAVRGDLAEVIDLRARLARQEAPAQTSHTAPTWGGEDPHQSPSRLRPVAELRSRRDLEPHFVGELGAELGGRAERESSRWSGASTDADSAVSSVTQDGIRLLARRARSSGELRRELVACGHDPIAVDAVILEFESSLYLDDSGLARVLTENLRERKRASRAQIRLKLRERLLPDGVIEAVLGDLDDEEEHELLVEAAEDRARRMRGLDRQTAERRLLGYLARRGWSGERATRAAREALAAQGISGDR